MDVQGVLAALHGESFNLHREGHSQLHRISEKRDMVTLSRLPNTTGGVKLERRSRLGVRMRNMTYVHRDHGLPVLAAAQPSRVATCSDAASE